MKNKNTRMRILKVSKYVAVAALFTFSMINVKGQGSSKHFGKGVNFVAKDSTMSMKMHVRMQALFSAGYDDLSEEYTTQLFIRRYRLKFGGFALNPNLRYKMELGISNRDQGNSSNAAFNSESSNIILDAVIKYKFANGHWDFWVGQTKLPGNRERVVSSADLQFVDRSYVNSRFNIDRDQGVQLRGKYDVGQMVVKPKFSWSMGEGRNITEVNLGGYDYTARLELFPMGSFDGKKDEYIESNLKRQAKPKLMIGATYDYNDRASRQRGQLGSFVYKTDGDGTELAQNSLQSLFLDLIFKYKSWSVAAEYANKTAEKNMDNISKGYGTGSGFKVQAGYLLKSNSEFAVRYSHVTPDDATYSSIFEQDEYTLGYSKYLVGHKLKIQSDISYFNTPNKSSSDDLRFRLQMELQI